MPKVTTELDIELAKWNAKIAQIKADEKRIAQEAKEVNLGEKLFGGLSGAMSAFGAAGIGVAIKATLGHFDEIGDAATRLGETPETIQRVARAAELSGSSLEGMATSVLKLEKNLGDVENAKPAAILESYGLSVERIMAMPLDEKIVALADAFKKARDDGTGVYELQQLLGKSSAELIPLLEEGGDSLRSMYEGTAVVGNEAVYQMAALNDELDNVIKNLQQMGGSALMTVHDKMLDFGVLIADMFGDKSALKKREAYYEQRKSHAEDKAAAVVARRESRAASLGTLRNMHDPEAERAAKEAEKIAREEEQRAQRIDALQKDIEAKRISMLPDDQQLAAFRDKLRAVLDGVSMVSPTMGELQRQIDLAPDNSDERERLLKTQKEAMETQSQIDRLSNKTNTQTVKSAHLPGAVTAAMNEIFGRSANELILDESKRQTQVLERIDKGIQKIVGRDDNPFGDEVFAF